MLRFAVFTVLAAVALVMPAPAARASSPPKIIGFGPDLIIVLSKPPTRDKSGVLEGAVLQGEVVSETTAAVNGWRSMRATFDISCADHADRVRAMTVFSQHNNLGQPAALTPPKDWIEASQNTTYGLAVIKYFCGDRRSKSAVLSSPVEEAPTDEPHAQAPASESAVSQDKPVQPLAAADPLSGAPYHSRSDDGGAQSDAGRPPVVAPPASRPMAVRPKAVAPGAFVVQLGSTTAETEAQSILAHVKAVKAQAFDRLGTRIETADVLGKRHYRAVVFGFSDAASAARFCAKLGSSRGCLIRRGA